MPVARDVFWGRVLEVRDVFMYSFDFEVFERPLGVEAYAAEAPWMPALVVEEGAISLVGRNGMGAVYACCERNQAKRCLHVDPGGTVVRMGLDLQQVVALVVELPYWPELLAQRSLGDLSSLRALARRLEHEICEDLHALPAARQELASFLKLPEIADPVLQVYELAVQPPPVTIWSPQGWRYESPIAPPS